MAEQEFRLLTKEELAELYRQHMKRDFPPDEMKPLAQLFKLMERGVYEPYALFREGKLIAYALYWKAGEDPYVMLDYFAVIPEERNKGTGSALLRDMLERFCRDGKGVFGEVEAPVSGDEATDALRRRRLGFYARAGLRRMNYTSRIFGVPFIVIAYGPEISEEGLMETHRRIYREALTQAAYEKNVFIPGAV